MYYIMVEYDSPYGPRGKILARRRTYMDAVLVDKEYPGGFTAIRFSDGPEQDIGHQFDDSFCL